MWLANTLGHPHLANASSRLVSFSRSGNDHFFIYRHREVRMKVSELSLDELKELVKGLVDDRIRELLGDPDLGLQLSDALRARLKQSLASETRVTGDEIADRLGLRW